MGTENDNFGGPIRGRGPTGGNPKIKRQKKGGHQGKKKERFTCGGGGQTGGSNEVVPTQKETCGKKKVRGKKKQE